MNGETEMIEVSGLDDGERGEALSTIPDVAVDGGARTRANDRSERAAVETTKELRFRDVAVSFGPNAVIRNVSFDVAKHSVTALIGPSGCGKTTLLRAVNRLHDHAGARVDGSILLGDVDIYRSGLAAEVIRSRVGMVFQRPNPFPTMSIYENVVSGLRFNGVRKHALLKEAAEWSLRSADLWDVVRGRLDQPAVRLSGGQQQRLCIARALAVQPEVLLMDEPCSALDPVSTTRIERLIAELARSVTVLIVTHNMAQAARISDSVAVFLPGGDGVGELAEFGGSTDVFDAPKDARTMAYINGHYD